MPSPPPAASSSATSNTRQMGAGLSKGQNGEAGRAVPAGSWARVMNTAPRNGVGGRRLSLPLPSAPLLSAGSIPRLLRAGQSSCRPEKPPATSAREQAQASQSQVRHGGSCSLGDGGPDGPQPSSPTCAGGQPPPSALLILIHTLGCWLLATLGLWEHRENSLVMFTCNATPAASQAPDAGRTLPGRDPALTDAGPSWTQDGEWTTGGLRSAGLAPGPRQ